MDLRCMCIPSYKRNINLFIFYVCVHGSSHLHGRWYPSWFHWSRESRTRTWKFWECLACSKISLNILFIYQITHSRAGKRVEFTPNSITISDMRDNSMIVVDEVNHQYCLYTFSKFIAKYYYALILTQVDDTSRWWHERFDHLNFKYMQQLWK
jgi:hypothetical protein